MNMLSEARKKRTEISSIELAQTLVNELVRKVSVDTAGAAKDFLIDATHAPGFEDKMRLYQLAVLLTAILNEERVTPQYVAVRKSIEDSFFSTSSDPNELLLRQVQFAMQDLGDLFGQKKEMSWALKWLAETGIHEANPAKLTLFASHWLGYYEAASKSLQQLKPV